MQHGGKQSIDGPDAGAVQAFVSTIRGKVIDSSDAEYESARKVYNAMIDRRPGLIVRCADVADVISCVGFARDHAMLLAIRAGGHSVPGFGTCDGGLVADLSAMKGIRVDPARRVARVETWLHVGRRCPRHACLRIGDAGWCHLDHGSLRSHARRWFRVPDATLWFVVRQFDLG